ncbi:MAG TPA: zf-HC2 domain-containing protein [Puia sp.]|nr:zf-HC2 domain-containing protein [Puia sp.]
MNCKDIQVKLIDYLDHRLDAVTAEELRQHLASCASCSREAEELRELLTAMSGSPLEMPPAALRENFNMMLQSELNMQATTTIIEEFPVTTGEAPQTARIVRFISPLWRVAAAVILLAGGIGIGMIIRTRPSESTTTDEIAAMRKELKEMKEEVMFNLINDESASQRIKAVSYVEQMSSPDQQVINALLNTLDHDKSVNVRLASLYSLSRFADRQAVRDSLVNSLKLQTDPIVQVVLINLLGEKRETKAIAPIKEIMTNKKTLPEVKDAAQRSLKIM